MSNERTTTKYFSVRDLTKFFEWQKTDEIIVGQHEAYVNLALGEHPLPIIYARQESDGNLILLGVDPNIIITALYEYAINIEVPTLRNRVLNTKLQVVVIEYTVAQDQVIRYYKDAGLI